MCNYCLNTSRHTGNSDKMLIDKDVKLENGIRIAIIDTALIDDEQGNSFIETRLTVTTEDGTCGNPIAKGRVKVHYCPYCGAKL